MPNLLLSVDCSWPMELNKFKAGLGGIDVPKSPPWFVMDVPKRLPLGAAVVAFSDDPKSGFEDPRTPPVAGAWLLEPLHSSG